jgi:hypothetical protein
MLLLNGDTFVMFFFIFHVFVSVLGVAAYFFFILSLFNVLPDNSTVPTA